MAKGFSAFDAAINVLDLNNYVFLDHLMELRDMSGSLATNGKAILIDKIEVEICQSVGFKSPEDIFLENEIKENKKRLFENLSEEAKQIVSIITDCPAELVDICSGGNLERVNIKKLAKKLRKQWRERLFVRKVLEEVYVYATKIEALNEN